MQQDSNHAAKFILKFFQGMLIGLGAVLPGISWLTYSVAAAIAALANSLTPFTLLVPAIIILVVAADLRKLPTSSTH